MPLKNSWLFPVIEAIHLIGMAAFVGTMVASMMIRKSGDSLPFRRSKLQRISEGSERNGLAVPVFPIATFSDYTRLTNIGLALLLLTGPILFAADPTRYLANPAFRVKMLIFALALIAHFKLRRFSSVLFILWSCVILAARAIADFDL